jgi:hypothetical protein
VFSERISRPQDEEIRWKLIVKTGRPVTSAPPAIAQKSSCVKNSLLRCLDIENKQLKHMHEQNYHFPDREYITRAHTLELEKAFLASLLRIRDIYPGSRIKTFSSQI